MRSTGKAILVMKPGPAAGFMSVDDPIFYDEEGWLLGQTGGRIRVALSAGCVLRHVKIDMFHVARDIASHRTLHTAFAADHISQIIAVPWNSYGYTVSLDRFPYG